MKLAFVGAGKVGSSIGKYLAKSGKTIIGYYSKTIESANQVATFVGTKVYTDLKELVYACDVLFIAVNDDEIKNVWNEIIAFDKEKMSNKIICHFSGSLSSEIFSDRKKINAYACSIHPMFAFSDKFTCYKQLNNVCFTLEGDLKAQKVLTSIFEKTQNVINIIPYQKKEKYHAAASLVSNHMIALYQMSIDMLIECGFDENNARELVKPLVIGNISKLLQTDSKQALTGPIERNDIETVKKHLSVMSSNEKKVYMELGKILVDISMEKNPDKDYTKLKELFKA